MGSIASGGVAQGLEQRAHNLLVDGSIPSTPTNQKTPCFLAGVFCEGCANSEEYLYDELRFRPYLFFAAMPGVYEIYRAELFYLAH